MDFNSVQNYSQAVRDAGLDPESLDGMIIAATERVDEKIESLEEQIQVHEY